MNLIMPLKDKSPIGRAKATLAIAQNVDEIFDGLDNVGTVHFARFLLLGDNICMISVYDGDFSNYIRDFIATIGSVFDAVMSEVEGGRSAHPHARQHRTISSIGCTRTTCSRRQISRRICSRCRMQKRALRPTLRRTNSVRLPRELILQLHANPNLSLGGGYRAYPGFSAAQVRQKFGLGW